MLAIQPVAFPILVALAAACAVSTAHGLAQTPQTGGPAQVDAAVVARVNGDPVTRAEFQRTLDNPLTRRQLHQEPGAKDLDAKALERLALRTLVQRRLMLQEASRRNITVTNAELDKGVTALVRRFDDLESFGQWMQEQKLDERELFETIRAEMVSTRVAGALVADVKLTEEDVREYYDAHKADLKIEEVWIQAITVKDKAAAEEIQKALKKGEDFGRLAQKRSLGLRATDGGNVGWVNSATLWPPMREAVSTLKPGEAIGPLQKGEEFLIVRLHERRRGKTKTLEEARAEIESVVLAHKQQATLQAWVTEQEKKAKIEVWER